MSVYQESLELIDRGKAGGNIGLYHGYQRLSEFVPNIQPASIYLIGGMTGVGKSAFAHSSFIHNPYNDWKAHYKDTIKLKIFLWTLEMNRQKLLTKFICRNIFIDTGKLVDVNYVLSKGKFRISEEIYQLTHSYADYYADFEDIVTIYGPDHPTGIFMKVQKYLKENGKDIMKEMQLPEAESGEMRTVLVKDKYEPNHPNSMVIAMIDHVNIMNTEKNYSKKQNIDKMCTYMVSSANHYSVTWVPIQQINRGVEEFDRFKKGSVDIKLSDFKETGDTTDAADIIFALNNPWAWEIDPYRGYKTAELQDRGRFLSILKNRDGATSKFLALLFLGEVGMFKELPPSHLMVQAEYDRAKALMPYYKLPPPPSIMSQTTN